MSGYIPTEDEIETAFHEFASKLETESPGTYEHAPELAEWKQAMYGFQRWRDQFRADAKVEAQEAWVIESRLAPRFWNRVDVREDTACWLFDGPELESGHRRYDSPAGQVAHRYAWALANVRLPTSLEVVRHRCDNPPCVNPAHLEIGLQVDNVADMIDRGRASFTRERCRNGHERTPDNIAVRSDGEQRCLTCQRESNRRQKERTGRFECPECCSLLVKGNMRRHRKMLHGITDETHQEWLALVKGQSGTFLDRADNLEAPDAS